MSDALALARLAVPEPSSTRDVPSAGVRGEHAHYECHQFLVCTRGHLSVVADDGTRREEYLLDGYTGADLPPMVCRTHHRCPADAVLCVFASRAYDPKDYIRNHDQSLAIRASAGKRN